MCSSRSSQVPLKWQPGISHSLTLILHSNRCMFISSLLSSYELYVKCQHNSQTVLVGFDKMFLRFKSKSDIFQFPIFCTFYFYFYTDLEFKLGTESCKNIKKRYNNDDRIAGYSLFSIVIRSFKCMLFVNQFFQSKNVF